MASSRSSGGRGPQIWGNVPQRNRNFTGRKQLLERLRRQMVGEDVTAVLPHAIQGLGGVGKTQLAIEYVYRYSNEYDLVWWVSADQSVLLRSSLAALAPRLVETPTSGGMEDSLAAVLDSLRRGEPYERWLIVFDNADQPESLNDLIPQGTGHVLITSRNHRWKSVTETIEVDVFQRDESIEFLTKRVTGVSREEADRLATELGDLPIALEQAAALQVEAGLSVEEYLELLSAAGSRLLGENKPSDYPLPVAAAWSLSMARVKEQMPIAMDLLRRCAYFGPEPIPRELLTRGRHILTSPFGESLRDPLTVTRSMRELGRYALARMDNSRGTIQVHRLIQRLVRDELAEDQVAEMQNDVHLLLAAADPQEPEKPTNWPAYDQLIAHIGPSGADRSTIPDVRQLVVNVVRYLYNVGDYSTCRGQIDSALEHWSGTPEDDIHVLRLRTTQADVLWQLGSYTDAYDLRRDVVTRTTALDPDSEDTLFVLNGHGADLRARGSFVEAQELDEDSLARHRRVFGDDHISTLYAANNLAVDYALNGMYREALALDRQTYEEALVVYTRDDAPFVTYSLSANGRDLRLIGRHAEALDYAEQADSTFRRLVSERVIYPDHAWVLAHTRQLSAAQRTLGQVDTAVEVARAVYAQYQRSSSSGPRHPDTLAAAATLGNALRSAGQYEDAAELLEVTVKTYRDVFQDHPFTHACAINLAIVRRHLGAEQGAKDLLTESRAALERLLGESHHYALISVNALATAHYSLLDFERARELDADSLPKLISLLGPNHPHSLAAAVNLSVDLRALDQIEEADSILRDALDRYRQTLGEEHPEARAASTGVDRIAVDFEPSPL